MGAGSGVEADHGAAGAVANGGVHGVTGGGTYEGLVGLTAHSFGHELLSPDPRAEHTYRTLGIADRLPAQQPASDQARNSLASSSKASTHLPMSASVCASDTSHWSSMPGGVKTPRLMPHSQPNSATSKSVLNL
jgi:hypothetical protein